MKDTDFTPQFNEDKYMLKLTIVGLISGELLLCTLLHYFPNVSAGNLVTISGLITTFIVGVVFAYRVTKESRKLKQ